MHPSDPPSPESLLAVTTWRSRAITPSEVYSAEFRAWAHANRAHLYLVLVGAKSTIVSIRAQHEGWRLHLRYFDGQKAKDHNLRVPFELLPRGATLVDGVLHWTNDTGTTAHANAAQISRTVLSTLREKGARFGREHVLLLERLFTYEVRYIGKSYGSAGERTAVERIEAGHKQVQQILAETMDLNPSSAVALIAMDTRVQGREAMFSLTGDNVAEVSAFMSQFLSAPDGPLTDEKRLIEATEALLIRSFPDAVNQQYKSFPQSEARSLREELAKSGVTHLGVHLDVSESVALLRNPDAMKRPSAKLRFAVNLATGAPETPQTTSPLAWSLA